MLELVEGAYVEQARLAAHDRCEVSTPTTFELDAGAVLG